MRVSTKLFKRIPSVLTKIMELRGKGKTNCLVLKINGNRYDGFQLENLEVKGEALSFELNGKKTELAFADINGVKRLRTRRYMLIADAQPKAPASEKKEQPKKETPKAAPKKVVKKEDK